MTTTIKCLVCLILLLSSNNVKAQKVTINADVSTGFDVSEMKLGYNPSTGVYFQNAYRPSSAAAYRDTDLYFGEICTTKTPTLCIDTAFTTEFAKLRPQVIRFPGGEEANYFHFYDGDNLEDSLCFNSNAFWNKGNGNKRDEIFFNFFGNPVRRFGVAEYHENNFNFSNFFHNRNYIYDFVDMVKSTEEKYGQSIEVLFVANLLQFFNHLSLGANNNILACLNPNDDCFQNRLQEIVNAIQFFKTHGVNVVGVELGNEMYALEKTRINGVNQVTPNDYFNLCNSVSDRLKAEFDNIPIGIIVKRTLCETDNTWNSTLTNFLLNPDNSNRYDALVLHSYLNNFGNRAGNFPCSSYGIGSGIMDDEDIFSRRFILDYLENVHSVAPLKDIWYTEWNASDPANNEVGMNLNEKLNHAIIIQNFMMSILEFNRRNGRSVIKYENLHSVAGSGPANNSTQQLLRNQNPNIVSSNTNVMSRSVNFTSSGFAVVKQLVPLLSQDRPLIKMETLGNVGYENVTEAKLFTDLFFFNEGGSPKLLLYYVNKNQDSIQLDIYSVINEVEDILYSVDSFTHQYIRTGNPPNTEMSNSNLGPEHLFIRKGSIENEIIYLKGFALGYVLFDLVGDLPCAFFEANLTDCDRTYVFVPSESMGTHIWTVSGDSTLYNDTVFYYSFEADTYTITHIFSNDSSCALDTFQLVINVNPPFRIDSLAISPEFCEQNNGGFFLSIVGGRSPYTLNIDNIETKINSNIFNFSSLSSGTYTLSITDKNNCSIDTTFTIIDTSTGLAITDYVLELGGCASCGSSLVLNTENGEQPLDFSYRDGVSRVINSGNVYHNIPNGFWWVEVVDAVGCIDSVLVEISSDSLGASVEIETISLNDYYDLVIIDYDGGAADSVILSLVTNYGNFPLLLFSGNIDNDSLIQIFLNKEIMLNIFHEDSAFIHITDSFNYELFLFPNFGGFNDTDTFFINPKQYFHSIMVGTSGQLKLIVPSQEMVNFIATAYFPDFPNEINSSHDGLFPRLNRNDYNNNIGNILFLLDNDYYLNTINSKIWLGNLPHDYNTEISFTVFKNEDIALCKKSIVKSISRAVDVACDEYSMDIKGNFITPFTRPNFPEGFNLGEGEGEWSPFDTLLLALYNEIADSIMGTSLESYFDSLFNHDIIPLMDVFPYNNDEICFINYSYLDSNNTRLNREVKLDKLNTNYFTSVNQYLSTYLLNGNNIEIIIDLVNENELELAYSLIEDLVKYNKIYSNYSIFLGPLASEYGFLRAFRYFHHKFLGFVSMPKNHPTGEYRIESINKSGIEFNATYHRNSSLTIVPALPCYNIGDKNHFLIYSNDVIDSENIIHGNLSNSNFVNLSITNTENSEGLDFYNPRVGSFNNITFTEELIQNFQYIDFIMSDTVKFGISYAPRNRNKNLLAYIDNDEGQFISDDFIIKYGTGDFGYFNINNEVIDTILWIPSKGINEINASFDYMIDHYGQGWHNICFITANDTSSQGERDTACMNIYLDYNICKPEFTFTAESYNVGDVMTLTIKGFDVGYIHIGDYILDTIVFNNPPEIIFGGAGSLFYNDSNELVYNISINEHFVDTEICYTTWYYDYKCKKTVCQELFFTNDTVCREASIITSSNQISFFDTISIAISGESHFYFRVNGETLGTSLTPFLFKISDALLYHDLPLGFMDFYLDSLISPYEVVYKAVPTQLGDFEFCIVSTNQINGCIDTVCTNINIEYICNNPVIEIVPQFSKREQVEPTKVIITDLSLYGEIEIYYGENHYQSGNFQTSQPPDTLFDGLLILDSNSNLDSLIFIINTDSLELGGGVFMFSSSDGYYCDKSDIILFGITSPDSCCNQIFSVSKDTAYIGDTIYITVSSECSSNVIVLFGLGESEEFSTQNPPATLFDGSWHLVSDSSNIAVYSAITDVQDIYEVLYMTYDEEKGCIDIKNHNLVVIDTSVCNPIFNIDFSTSSPQINEVIYLQIESNLDLIEINWNWQFVEFDFDNPPYTLFDGSWQLNSSDSANIMYELTFPYPGYQYFCFDAVNFANSCSTSICIYDIEVVGSYPCEYFPSTNISQSIISLNEESLSFTAFQLYNYWYLSLNNTYSISSFDNLVTGDTIFDGLIIIDFISEDSIELSYDVNILGLGEYNLYFSSNGYWDCQYDINYDFIVESPDTCCNQYFDLSESNILVGDTLYLNVYSECPFNKIIFNFDYGMAETDTFSIDNVGNFFGNSWVLVSDSLGYLVYELVLNYQSLYNFRFESFDSILGCWNVEIRSLYVEDTTPCNPILNLSISNFSDIYVGDSVIVNIQSNFENTSIILDSYFHEILYFDTPVESLFDSTWILINADSNELVYKAVFFESGYKQLSLNGNNSTMSCVQSYSDGIYIHDLEYCESANISFLPSSFSLISEDRYVMFTNLSSMGIIGFEIEDFEDDSGFFYTDSPPEFLFDSMLVLYHQNQDTLIYQIFTNNLGVGIIGYANLYSNYCENLATDLFFINSPVSCCNQVFVVSENQINIGDTLDIYIYSGCDSIGIYIKNFNIGSGSFTMSTPPDSLFSWVYLGMIDSLLHYQFIADIEGVFELVSQTYNNDYECIYFTPQFITIDPYNDCFNDLDLLLSTTQDVNIGDTIFISLFSEHPEFLLTIDNWSSGWLDYSNPPSELFNGLWQLSEDESSYIVYQYILDVDGSYELCLFTRDTILNCIDSICNNLQINEEDICNDLISYVNPAFSNPQEEVFLILKSYNEIIQVNLEIEDDSLLSESFNINFVPDSLLGNLFYKHIQTDDSIVFRLNTSLLELNFYTLVIASLDSAYLCFDLNIVIFGITSNDTCCNQSLDISDDVIQVGDTSFITFSSICKLGGLFLEIVATDSYLDEEFNMDFPQDSLFDGLLVYYSSGSTSVTYTYVPDTVGSFKLYFGVYDTINGCLDGRSILFSSINEEQQSRKDKNSNDELLNQSDFDFYNKKGVENFLIYPNPFSQEIYFRFKVISPDSYTLKIVDMLGKTIYSNSYRLEEGDFLTNVLLKDLPTSSYMYILHRGDIVINSGVLIKAK